jgi:hypothetical protein
VKKNFWRRKGKCILPSRQKGEKVHEGGCHGLHIASISPFTDYFYQYAKSFSSFFFAEKQDEMIKKEDTF